MQRILIIAKQSLGDIILQLGVIQALKEKNPAVQIDVACYEKYRPALEKQSEIAEILTLDLASGKSRGFFTVLKQIKQKHYDIILSFGPSKQAVWWGFLARIKIRIGTANQPFGFLLTRSLRERDTQLNSFEYYFKLAQLLAPGLSVAFPKIPIEKKETQHLRASLYKQKVARKFIVWHIGSSLEEKRYPIFQIVETLRLFHKKRITLPVVFAGGRGDERFLEELEATVNAANIRTTKVFFADTLQFQATAALFSLAHLVI
ncbi:MAG TPA: glycosyltransferase family 9 protein, partial [Turneriella sp.]|nr:glycosyltransferase family 9 protein [Turneriella sp.]